VTPSPGLDPETLSRELEAKTAADRTSEYVESVDIDEEFGGKRMIMNFGPQHPATHGTLRNVFELEGETIIVCDPEIGYLHTGFEKLAEHMTYTQWVTVTDRMNYLSAMNNNIGYAVAVEELLGIEVPERCQVLRVILAELSRIADHILCLGLQGMDLGAFSVMLWAFEKREVIYDIFEAVCGARLTTSWTRVGGIMRDVPDFFEKICYEFLDEFETLLDEFRLMLLGNRIFLDRVRQVGVLTHDEAVSWGVTGPIGRASGVDYDVRRDRPYLGYERYDLQIPVQSEGDTLARFRQRLEECEQSMKLMRQGLAVLAPGPVQHDDFKTSLPEKKNVYGDMESLIHHFKLVMLGHGIQPAKGAEFYSATEAPCGELGFFIVSNGSDTPYRIRIRPPSLYNYATFPMLVQGGMISDAVAILSSFHVIAGELDR
jgi:NADH dehydrogenase I D subunit